MYKPLPQDDPTRRKPNIDKAIKFYELAYKKKNYEAFQTAF